MKTTSTDFVQMINEVYRFIIKKQIIKNMMIKLPENSQSQKFSFVNEQIVSATQKNSICLQAEIVVDSQHTQKVRLVITSFLLYICALYSQFSEYLYYTKFSSTLKFQIIFEQDFQKKVQNGKSPQRLGFRLLKEGTAPVQFYFKSEPLLDIWLKYLSKNLNQYGFHNLYKPVRKLGKGRFATVYEVERVTDRVRFAAKAFSKASTINSSNPVNRQVLLNEIEMLRTFDSPHIMKLQAVFESANSIYIISELFAHGQLHSRINKMNAKFLQKDVKSFMRGTITALYQMHKARIMHRDIKPQNIMLRGKTGLNPVLADFGLAADIDSEDYLFFQCGTPGYIAPEIFISRKEGKLTTKCDIFSLGAVFHIFLLKRLLFEGQSLAEIIQKNKKCKFNFDSADYKNIDSKALGLLKQMLEVDPQKRISAEQILAHPYLIEEINVKSEINETNCLINIEH